MILCIQLKMYVHLQLEVVIWKYCSGHGHRDVHGIYVHVPPQLVVAILKSYNVATEYSRHRSVQLRIRHTRCRICLARVLAPVLSFALGFFKHGASGVLINHEWARANECPWDTWTCTFAALGGQLEVLKWLRANGCPWDEYTCAYAARGGHLEVLQWLCANGCPWNKFTCAEAANGYHLDVLQWAHARGCPWER